MDEGVTPYVWSMVAKYGTISSSFATAHESLKDLGISFSLKRIRRLIYMFDRRGLTLRDQKIHELKTGKLEITDILKDRRVIISVDGGRTRKLVYNSKKRNPKTNRKSYTGEWVEPKLLTIYTVDERGKKIKSKEVPLVNDGTYGDYKELLKILEMYLVSMGIAKAKEILFVSDGAIWIWKHIPLLLERLGCKEKTLYLLDFYHTTAHLYSFAEVIFKQEKERLAWFKKARKQLKNGRVEFLIR